MGAGAEQKENGTGEGNKGKGRGTGEGNRGGEGMYLWLLIVVKVVQERARQEVHPLDITHLRVLRAHNHRGGMRGRRRGGNKGTAYQTRVGEQNAPQAVQCSRALWGEGSSAS